MNSLIECNAVSEEDKEIVSYGMVQGIIIITNIITTVIIGYVFGMMWQSLLFLMAYISLRSYVGGYHARTRLKCYLSSVISLCVILGIMKYVNFTTTVSLTLAALCGIIIFLCAPRADENKPFDEIEVIIFRKRSRIICLIEIVAIVLSYIFGLEGIGLCILMSMVSCIALLYVDMLKQLLVDKNEELGMY